MKEFKNREKKKKINFLNLKFFSYLISMMLSFAEIISLIKSPLFKVTIFEYRFSFSVNSISYISLYSFTKYKVNPSVNSFGKSNASDKLA